MPSSSNQNAVPFVVTVGLSLCGGISVVGGPALISISLFSSPSTPPPQPISSSETKANVLRVEPHREESLAGHDPIGRETPRPERDGNQSPGVTSRSPSQPSRTPPGPSPKYAKPDAISKVVPSKPVAPPDPPGRPSPPSVKVKPTAPMTITRNGNSLFRTHGYEMTESVSSSRKGPIYEYRCQHCGEVLHRSRERLTFGAPLMAHRSH